MSDLISRQAALDALGDEPEVWTGKDEYAQGLNNQWHYDRNAIKALPTVDAVPVVRCGDCRFWSKYPGSSAAPQYHECMARMTYIGNLYTTAWEYCSRGERKDGDADGV